jgi:hypothetical protein
MLVCMYITKENYYFFLANKWITYINCPRLFGTVVVYLYNYIVQDLPNFLLLRSTNIFSYPDSTSVPVLSCPVPSDIPNSEKLYDGQTMNSIALYSCKPGYQSNTAKNLVTCDGTQWETTNYSCTGKSVKVWFSVVFKVIVTLSKEMKQCLCSRKVSVYLPNSFNKYAD